MGDPNCASGTQTVETLSGQELRSGQVRSATAPATRATPVRTERKPRRGRVRHGVYQLKSTMKELADRGLRVFDGRTAFGKSARRWRDDLVRDLGGDPSTGQAAVIELALRTKVMLDSIDAWLLVQPSLINRRKRALIPIAAQRQQLADALVRYLTALGLERKAKQLPSLEDYLSGAEPVEAEKQPEGES